MSNLLYNIEFRCPDCDNSSFISSFCAYTNIAVKDMFRDCVKSGRVCEDCGRRMTFSMLEIKSKKFMENFLKKNNDINKDTCELEIICNYCKSRWTVVRDLKSGNEQRLDDDGLKSMGISCINPNCSGKPKPSDRVDQQLSVKSLHRIHNT